MSFETGLLLVCVLVTLVIWNAGAGEMQMYERLGYSALLTIMCTALIAVIVRQVEAAA